MDINITDLFNSIDPSRYSASQAELGPDAAVITYARALDHVTRDRPLTHDQLDPWRAFLKASGGWAEDDVDALHAVELQALFLQWVAADMRETGLDANSTPEDWAKYETDASAGLVPGSLYRTDDGQVFFSLSPTT